MQIILAKTAGFCFGVDRAVEMVAESVRSGNKTATLGPIIHNRHVVDKFLKLGVREIAAPEEAEAGETVIIRAHGVPKRVQEKLSGGGVERSGRDMSVRQENPYNRQKRDGKGAAHYHLRLARAPGGRGHRELLR